MRGAAEDDQTLSFTSSPRNASVSSISLTGDPRSATVLGQAPSSSSVWGFRWIPRARASLRAPIVVYWNSYTVFKMYREVYFDHGHLGHLLGIILKDTLYSFDARHVPRKARARGILTVFLYKFNAQMQRQLEEMECKRSFR